MPEEAGKRPLRSKHVVLYEEEHTTLISSTRSFVTTLSTSLEPVCHVFLVPRIDFSSNFVLRQMTTWTYLSVNTAILKLLVKITSMRTGPMRQSTAQPLERTNKRQVHQAAHQICLLTPLIITQVPAMNSNSTRAAATGQSTTQRTA